MQSASIRGTMALLFLSGAATVCAADVEILAARRIHNAEGDRCGWCALETLARHHNLPGLFDLSAKHTGRARPEEMEAELDAAQINFRVQDPGCRNTLILRYAIQENRGALVGFRPPEPGAGRHIVTLVGITSECVRVLDPNDADGQVRTMPLGRFLSWWDGFVLVLEP
jgi:hypothetical protein